MADQEYFTTGDCSFWLYQMSKVNTLANSNIFSYLSYTYSIVFSALPVGCSVILMAAFTLQTKCKNIRFGNSHIILLLWTIIQIPVAVFLYITFYVRFDILFPLYLIVEQATTFS